MNAVLDSHTFVADCGMHLSPDTDDKDYVQLGNTRNHAICFKIKVKDWLKFVNKVKKGTFKITESKPGVNIKIVSKIYMIRASHGCIIEFRIESNHLAYHLNQKRCQEFLNDIKNGKFDLIN